MAHFLKQVIDSYIYVFFAIFCLDKWLTWHFLLKQSSASALHAVILCTIDRTFIISKYYWSFSSNITTVENISPRNLCHSCWRAVKHFVKKQSAIVFAALQKRFVYKLYKPVSSYRKTAIIPMKYKYLSITVNYIN